MGRTSQWTFHPPTPAIAVERVVNVVKLSASKLSSPHPIFTGASPSSVGGLLSAFSFPLHYLPFHRAALSTSLRSTSAHEISPE